MLAAWQAGRQAGSGGHCRGRPGGSARDEGDTQEQADDADGAEGEAGGSGGGAKLPSQRAVAGAPG